MCASNAFFTLPPVLPAWPDDAAPPVHPYLHGGSWTDGNHPFSPDPLRAYRWDERLLMEPLEPLQCHALLPAAWTVEQGVVQGLDSLGTPGSRLLISAPATLRLDFGVESAAWLEFETSDRDAQILLGVSEYNRPAIVNAGAQNPEKTARPEHVGGDTYRLKLNDEFYEGLRFGWLRVVSCRKPVEIRNLRAVCRIKPVNYAGSFTSDLPLLNRIWETGAYAVKLNINRDHFGAILMERSDRHSWTGDSCITQAVAMAALGNFPFVHLNTCRMQDDDNGIETYSIYWVLALADYVERSGDIAFLEQQAARLSVKLRRAAGILVKNSFSGYPAFCGHDDRLGAFVEETPPENFQVYRFLTLRSARAISSLLAFSKLPAADLRDAIDRVVQAASGTTMNLGLHAGSEALIAGMFSKEESIRIGRELYTDPIRNVSYSPFNGHFVLEGMAVAEQWQAAFALLDRCWGTMLRLGATCFWESFRPEWAAFTRPNDAIPHGTHGYTSLCHPWSSGPTRWLSDHLLGVAPTAPGFRSVALRPVPRFSEWVAGTIPSPHGPLVIERDAEHIRLTLPEGCSGSGPAGEALAAGENVLRLTEAPVRIMMPSQATQHDWRWLPDGDFAKCPNPHDGWITFGTAADGGDSSGNLDGITLEIAVENEASRPASLARRETSAAAGDSPFHPWGALRTRMPLPCQQVIVVDVTGDLSDVKAVAVYCRDHHGEAIEQTLDVFDLPGRDIVLETREMTNFADGTVHRFAPQGSFRLRLSGRYRADASLSALVFER